MKTRKHKFKEPSKGDMFLDAVAAGRLDDIEQYLDEGGDPKYTDCMGQTAIHKAVAHKKNDILDMLLVYFNEDELDARDMYGLPAHLTAMKFDNPVGLRKIANYRRNITQKPYFYKNYSFNSNSSNVNNYINNVNNYKTESKSKTKTKSKSKTKTESKSEVKRYFNFINEDNLIIYPTHKMKTSNYNLTPITEFIFNNKNIKSLKINAPTKKRRSKKSNKVTVTKRNNK